MEFLDFLRFKIENDSLTLDEELSILRVIENDIPLHGTSDDFAAYYHQSPVNVRSVLHRNIMPKPVRRVMYSFSAFNKIVPKKWKLNCCTKSPDKQRDKSDTA